MQVLGIWLGYGIAVTGMALGTHDGPATLGVGFIGAFFAFLATVIASGNLK